MYKRAFMLLACALVCSWCHGSARATLIPSVASTGQGQPVGVVDPNYTLIAGPAGFTTNPGNVAYTIAPINGIYITPPAGTEWIGPSTNNLKDEPAGNYDYRTTFTLSGLDLSTVVITGSAYTDNSLTNILLNGVPLGYSGGGFTTPVNYTINSGFLAGTNTLDFIVNNAVAGPPNPTALLVIQSGQTVIPEPSTLAMAGLAGAILIGYSRSRNRARASRPV